MLSISPAFYGEKRIQCPPTFVDIDLCYWLPGLLVDWYRVHVDLGHGDWR